MEPRPTPPLPAEAPPAPRPHHMAPNLPLDPAPHDAEAPRRVADPEIVHPSTHWPSTRPASRVGRRRGGAQGGGGHAVSPRSGRVSPSSAPSLRLHHPLIKPDVTISVIRLSDRVHRVASSAPARSSRATDTARPS